MRSGLFLFSHLKIAIADVFCLQYQKSLHIVCYMPARIKSNTSTCSCDFIMVGIFNYLKFSIHFETKDRVSDDQIMHVSFLGLILGFCLLSFSLPSGDSSLSQTHTPQRTHAHTRVLIL